MRWDERVGRRIKLRDLHLLEAAARTGSLAKAAKSLGMSQPAVSYAIAEMERSLAVPLLDRTSQGVVPTAFGHALLKRSVVVFNEIRHGLNEIETLADPTRGEIRLGTPQPMLPVTTAIIDRMSQRYPNVSFHLSVESTHVLLRELRERAIELVISRMLAPTVDDDLSIEVLFQDELAIMAGRGNPWTKRKSVTLEQLLQGPWVLPPPDGWLHPLLQKAFGAKGLKVPSATVSTLSTHAISMLVARGPFLTVHPQTMLRVPTEHRLLSALPVSLRETRTPVGLISLKHHTLSPVAKVFAASAWEVVKELIGPQRGRRH